MRNLRTAATVTHTLLARLDRWVEAFEALVLIFAILAMAALSIANVIGRNLFDHSLSFVTELNQALIVLITFVGIGYGVRHARHIRMSALYDQLHGWPRKALLVLSHFGTAVLLLALAWYAVQYVEQNARIGRVTPALQIPLYWVYMWVPVGLAMGALQYLLAGFTNLLRPGIHLARHLPEHYDEPGNEPGDGPAGGGVL